VLLTEVHDFREQIGHSGGKPETVPRGGYYVQQAWKIIKKEHFTGNPSLCRIIKGTSAA